jgi:hypothetical protein
MPALALICPSPTLAGAADPRAFAATGPQASIDDLDDWARVQIRPLLERLPPGGGSGDVDERWYWVAPLLLDADRSGDWWETAELPAAWSAWDKRANVEGSSWAEHVQLAADAAADRLDPPLGPRPDDLELVLARLAVGAPGTLALRALARVTGLSLWSTEVRVPAAQVAWALRGLFNSPEATALLTHRDLLARGPPARDRRRPAGGARRARARPARSRRTAGQASGNRRADHRRFDEPGARFTGVTGDVQLDHGR